MSVQILRSVGGHPYLIDTANGRLVLQVHTAGTAPVPWSGARTLLALLRRQFGTTVVEEALARQRPRLSLVLRGLETKLTSEERERAALASANLGANQLTFRARRSCRCGRAIRSREVDVGWIAARFPSRCRRSGDGGWWTAGRSGPHPLAGRGCLGRRRGVDLEPRFVREPVLRHGRRQRKHRRNTERCRLI